MGEGTALDGPWAGAAAGDGEDIGGCGCGPRRAAASCPEAPVIARRATITKQRIISEKYLSCVTQIKGEYRNRNTKKSGTSGDVCRLSGCPRVARTTAPRRHGPWITVAYRIYFEGFGTCGRAGRGFGAAGGPK